MIGRPHEVRDVVFRAEQAIETLQAVIRRFIAAGVEVVLLFGQDDDGLRRESGQKVFVVEAKRQCSRWALLHVGPELVFHVSPELGDETAGRRHGPPILDAAEPRGHGSAAGVAGDAEMAHINLFARHQVVERANPVPGAPHPEALVDEHLLDAGVIVLAGSRPVQRLQVGIQVLHPLALADRIENQHHITQTRQSLAEGLIRLNGLAVIRVSAGCHHTRKREVPPLRDVKIGGHQKPWPAFEQDVLYLVGVALHDFGHAGIERCFLGKRSKQFANLAPNGLDVVFRVGPRGQTRQPLQPLLVYFVLARHEELLHHTGKAVEGEKRGYFGGGPSGLHGIGRKLPSQRDPCAADRKRVEHLASRDALTAGRFVFMHSSAPPAEYTSLRW